LSVSFPFGKEKYVNDFQNTQGIYEKENYEPKFIRISGRSPKGDSLPGQYPKGG